MSEPVEALLFDLGGVVINIDFNRAFARWAKHSGCACDAVRSRFSQDAAYEQHERDTIDATEYFAHLRKMLDLEISDAQLLDGWNAIFVREVPGISELLERAAAHVRLYAFSNSNRAHEKFWSKRYAGVLSHFRKIFVSSTIGLRKPDAEAFAHVVRDIGVPASRIVFFDDVLANVEGASASGLQAVHVPPGTDMKAILANIVPGF